MGGTRGSTLEDVLERRPQGEQTPTWNYYFLWEYNQLYNGSEAAYLNIVSCNEDEGGSK